MMRFFNKFVGNRAPLPNGVKNSVKVYCWGPDKLLPALHTALEITKGDERYYLSFSPYTIEGLEHLSILEIRSGVSAYFQENFEQERLYRGYRRAHEDDKEINKLCHDDILKRAQQLPSHTQDVLKILGNPNETVELHSLNLEKMIKKVNFLKRPSEAQSESKLIQAEKLSYETRWASWASTYFHQKNTYNCSSIILDILYEGGLNNLISTYHDTFGAVGGLLGTALGIASYMNNRMLQEAVLKLAISFFAGRGVGGFADGWNDIQSILNLIVRNAKTDSTQQNLSAKCKSLQNGALHIGLRLMSATFSSLVALVKYGPIVPEWLATTPELVMNLVHQAKREEDTLYLPVGYSRPILA